MARKGGNPDIAKHGFKKGDPRINRKGAPKKLPKLRKLLKALLGGEEGTNIEDTPIAEIIKALQEEVKNKKGLARVAAAKEILDRVYGKAKNEEEKTHTGNIEWVETKTYKK